MPISKLQSQILKIIAMGRDPESYIAEGLPINRSGPRYSEDIDIFHDHEERVAQAAEADAKLLEKDGYDVHWLRRQAGVHTAEIAGDKGRTRLDWVADSDFRFFPAIRDPEFGYVLHIADLAVNKLMAAATRREVRDVVDLVHIHEQHLPLGAIIWAGVVVAPGFSPESLLEELRRNARFAPDDFRRLEAAPPVDGAKVMTSLRTAIKEAEAFVAQMPTDTVGTIYLENGRPVMPDPSKLDSYITHQPQRRGHWPGTTEISTAMLEKLQRPMP